MTTEETAIVSEEQIEQECQQADKSMALMLLPCTEVVKTLDDANRLAKDANEIAKVRKIHEARWTVLVSQAKAIHTRLCNRRSAFLEKYITAEKSRCDKVVAWRRAEEDRRRREQEEADELARQAALAEAFANEDTKLAKQIETGKVVVSAPEVIAAPVKVAGMSFTTTKKGKIVDKDAFVRGCLTRKRGLSLELLIVDDARLNDMVKATAGTVPYPGVQVYEDTTDRRTGR